MELDRAIRGAETESRFEFSVFVGASEGEPQAFAQRLHAALGSPDRSILVMVDPDQRALEIVTGADVRRDLSDDAVALAGATMQSDFQAGELVRGIASGVCQLAESARKPRTLHV